MCTTYTDFALRNWRYVYILSRLLLIRLYTAESYIILILLQPLFQSDFIDTRYLSYKYTSFPLIYTTVFTPKYTYPHYQFGSAHPLLRSFRLIFVSSSGRTTSSFFMVDSVKYGLQFLRPKNMCGWSIECMAGKAAALHGHVYDASPFTFSESRPAINYFGELLQQCK